MDLSTLQCPRPDTTSGKHCGRGSGVLCAVFTFFVWMVQCVEGSCTSSCINSRLGRPRVPVTVHGPFGDWSIFRRKRAFCERSMDGRMDLSPSAPPLPSSCVAKSLSDKRMGARELTMNTHIVPPPTRVAVTIAMLVAIVSPIADRSRNRL